ncbi:MULTISPECIES: XyeA family cyclophane-containing RiPP triceptide [Serratia]|uniref:XyeA family cyclophane-containing RiPP triceptide n=1 Tax=Serratia TaxID=613 RepID=UPI0009080E92|nr:MULTISPECIES: XyeA family cyclophane-containing RiPP triceptide [Serratia]MDI3198001.1 XyeA family putative rSAM-modified RiPP [Serratia ureilytica]MEB5995381.1 XyeA family putative rSAM-modified RiPP [Serratia ureilytica]
MSKLAKEISMNKAAVIIDGDKKDIRRALTQSMLDSISGGWVNAFARWSRRW